MLNVHLLRRSLTDREHLQSSAVMLQRSVCNLTDVPVRTPVQVHSGIFRNRVHVATKYSGAEYTWGGVLVRRIPV